MTSVSQGPYLAAEYTIEFEGAGLVASTPTSILNVLTGNRPLQQILFDQPLVAQISRDPRYQAVQVEKVSFGLVQREKGIWTTKEKKPISELLIITKK